MGGMPIAMAPNMPPGTLKGRGKVGFAEAQYGQRHELQEKAGAVEQDVERDRRWRNRGRGTSPSPSRER